MSASQGVPLPVRVTARTIKLNTVISRSPGALDRGPSGLIEVPAFICGRAYKEIYSWIALVWVSSKVCCLGNFNKCSKEKKSWLQDRRAVCTSVTLGNDHHLRHLGTVCRGGGGETKANIVSLPCVQTSSISFHAEIVDVCLQAIPAFTSRGWVIIYQPEQMTENCTSLLNSGPRSNGRLQIKAWTKLKILINAGDV